AIQLAGQLLEKGTMSRIKAEIDESIDFIGASVGSNSNGVIGSGLSRHTETILDLMADILLNPSFPEEEFDKLKKQTLSGIAIGKDDPGQMSNNVSSVVTYGADHPYGEIPTEESISLTMVEDCKEYYNTYFHPNLSYLVFVGDITPKKAKELAQKYFGGWKKTFAAKGELPKPMAPEANQVHFVSKPGSSQSSINITYPVNFKPGSDDAIKVNILNQIFGGSFTGRLFQNIREDKGYSYGAYSTISSDQEVGSFSANANVRNEVTDSALVEFLYEMKRISTEMVTDEELQTAKNMIMGSFARQMEQPTTIARFALNTARYRLPANYYATYLERLDAITKEEILEVAKKYIRPENANIVVVGNKETGEKLKQFSADGKLKYYDGQGKEVHQLKVVLPDDTKAEDIVSNYIKAIGGKAALAEVKDMTINFSASVQGMTMEMKRVIKNGKMLMEVKANGMVMNQVKFDGEKAAISQMGQPQEVDAGTLEGLKEDAMLFPELAYDKLGKKLSLKGGEMLDGNQVYVIEVESASGKKQTEYYDIKSGLKIRSQSSEGGNLVQTDYKNYQEVEGGILMPFEIVSIGQAPFPLTFTVSEVKVNQGVGDDVFKVE
ncbi:MAG: insulinase family protein, partial [Saprospiraceae bacterium]|nr:insulinase family protein [Saprospiraceae bacterium]